jgi:hypothetical protein
LPASGLHNAELKRRRDPSRLDLAPNFRPRMFAGIGFAKMATKQLSKAGAAPPA